MRTGTQIPGIQNEERPMFDVIDPLNCRKIKGRFLILSTSLASQEMQMAIVEARKA